MDPNRSSRIVEICGVGGNQDVVVQKVESISLGGQTVSNFHVEFGDIAAFGFDALIGSDLLDALNACVDYKRREIQISRN